MTDYIVLQPVHLGSGQLGESRKKALKQLAAEADCHWGGQPSIGRYLIKLADEEREMMAYYCTGGNGSVLQLENGCFADTVCGDTSEDMDAHDALPLLEAEADDFEWQTSPLFGDFSQDEMLKYCGVK